MCRIYATGVDVVWKAGALLVPLPADIHSEPLDVPMTADAIPIANDQDRQHIEDYLKHPDHKAYAVKSMPPIASFPGSGWNTSSEAVRMVIERCADWYQAPCLLISVDGMLTLQIPKSWRIIGLFMLTTDPQMTNQDKQRVGEVYREKEWRALARGAGGWYPVADAPSEAAAVDGALGACAAHDRDCQLYAIGNFRVADQ